MGAMQERKLRHRRRQRPSPPPRSSSSSRSQRRMRAATAAAASCSLVLATSGTAALSSSCSWGVGVGLGLGVVALAESSVSGGNGGGTRSSPDAARPQSAEAGEGPEVPILKLKPLVMDDLATVVHVTEPILQKEKEEEEEDEEQQQQQQELVLDDGANNDDAAEETDRVNHVEDDTSNDDDDEQQQQQQQQQHQQQAIQQPATTASEALHDDSLSSVPPLPSDLVRLAEEEGRDHARAAEGQYRRRDALDSNSNRGEYEHGQQGEQEVATEEDDGVTEDVGGAPTIDNDEHASADEGTDAADSSTSEETSGGATAMEGGGAAAEADGTAAGPSGSESVADATGTVPERPAESTVDRTEDGTAAEQTDATEDSPKNRVVVDYASKAAGALVLEKSPNLKGTSNLLNNDNDRYAIAPCDEERKYVVIGLSEDILVKQLVLANYERYSSHPKEFQVLGSQTYPDSTWIDLGTYTAQPGNNAQTFDLIDPTWARYLKLRFITHYGAEHYCTVTQIKVHGSTMLQGFHEQWKESEEEVKKVIEAVEGDADEGDVEEEEEEVGPNEDIVEADGGEEDDETIAKAVEGDAGGPNIDNDGTSEDVAPDAPVEASDDDAKMQEGDAADASETKEEEATTSHDDATTDASVEVPRDPSPSAQKNEENGEIPDEAEEQGSEGVTGNGSEMNVASDKSKGANVITSDTEDAKDPPREVAQKDLTAHTSDPQNIADDTGTAAAAPVGSSATDDKVDESNSYGLTPSIDALSAEDNGGPVCIPFRYGIAPTMCADVNISEMSADPFVAAMNNFNRNQSALSLTSIARESADSTMSDGTVASMIGNLSSLASVSDAFIRSSINKASNVIRGSNSVISTKNKMEDTRSAGSHHAVLDMIDDSAFEQPKKTKSPKTAKTGAEKESSKKTPPKKHEEPLVPGAMDAEVFAALASKYPAASCLKDLNYQEFKTKIIEARAKKKPAVVEKANGPPHPGKIEPIFKTLTDEIKSLQLSQSVYDQYIKAVTSCYQRIILDVTNELKTTESVQAERLSLLEDAIRDLQSQNRGHSAIESFLLPVLALIWFAGSSILGALANFVQPKNWFVAADMMISDSRLFAASGAEYLLGLAGFALSVFLFVSFLHRKLKRRLLHPRFPTNGDKRRSRSAPDLLA